MAIRNFRMTASRHLRFDPNEIFQKCEVGNRSSVVSIHTSYTYTDVIMLLFRYIDKKPITNAKVSTRQHRPIRRNSLNRPPLSNINVIYTPLKSTFIYQCATISSLTIQVYFHLFSHCCLPNMPSSAKVREKLNLQQLKVIQSR